MTFFSSTAARPIGANPQTMMPSAAPDPCPALSRHLLIAGTGRAGTTFLVRYLDAFGLDTNLAHGGKVGNLDDRSNAGLEDLLLPVQPNLPYVVKSPWTYQFIDELLGSEQIRLDAVILPLRDLAEAASSRSIVQLQAMHHDTPWLGALQQPWEMWGHAPGGTVYSVNPVDQARLLAVGLHRLLEPLVAAEVPLIMLAFPRLIKDPDYLFRNLAPILPAGSSLEQARRIHAAIAEPALVRVGDELDALPHGRAMGLTFMGPTTEALDRTALARELAPLPAGWDHA
jgi:hypothetical protein